MPKPTPGFFLTLCDLKMQKRFLLQLCKTFLVKREQAKYWTKQVGSRKTNTDIYETKSRNSSAANIQKDLVLWKKERRLNPAGDNESNWCRWVDDEQGGEKPIWRHREVDWGQKFYEETQIHN